MRLIDADALLEKYNMKCVDMAECLTDANTARVFERYCIIADAVEIAPTIDAVSKEKYVHALTALQLANEKLAYLGYKPYTEKDGADIIDVWVKQMLFEERHKQNAVEVKHGEWIKSDDVTVCSCCGFALEDWIHGIFYNYCPNCGAKMIGDEDERKN